MTDETTQDSAAPAANDTAPAVHEVERPAGEEFPTADFEGIAAKLGAELKHVAFVIEEDLAAGVRKLKGWLKEF